jgi:Ras-related GTP-binding protein A/B
VFDIEVRDFQSISSHTIVGALGQFSRTASIFLLVHKMDLFVPSQRGDIYNDHVFLVCSRSY